MKVKKDAVRASSAYTLANFHVPQPYRARSKLPQDVPDQEEAYVVYPSTNVASRSHKAKLGNTCRSLHSREDMIICQQSSDLREDAGVI